MKPTEEQLKELALIHVLEEMNFTKRELEAMLIGVLNSIYKNEKSILGYLGSLEEMRKSHAV